MKTIKTFALVFGIFSFAASCNHPHKQTDWGPAFVLLLAQGCTTCKVFISTGVTSGNLGGVAGADLACNADAGKPSGTYAALITGSGRQACMASFCGPLGPAENIGWVIHPYARYVQSDGMTDLATATSSGLWGFPLRHAMFDYNKNTFTGLNLDWTSTHNNCLEWSSDSVSNLGHGGTIGVRGNADGSLMSLSMYTCNTTTQRLICVEQ